MQQHDTRHRYQAMDSRDCDRLAEEAIEDQRTKRLPPADPAGKLCSSTRAELTAIEAVLREVTNRIGPETQTVYLMCDFRGANFALQDPANARSTLVTEIWSHISDILRRGNRQHIQWVPGHARLAGNVEFDCLSKAGRQAAADRHLIDLPTAKAAIAGKTRRMCAARAAASHPHSTPCPDAGYDELPRRGHVALAIAQLRVGCSTLTADTRLRFGLADSDACPDYGEPDSVAHMLLDCPAYQGPRKHRWGPLPTLGEVVDQDAQKMWACLQEVGRVTPDPA